MDHNQRVVINEPQTSGPKAKQEVLARRFQFQLYVNRTVIFPFFEFCVQLVNDPEDVYNGHAI